MASVRAEIKNGSSGPILAFFHLHHTAGYYSKLTLKLAHTGARKHIPYIYHMYKRQQTQVVCLNQATL